METASLLIRATWRTTVTLYARCYGVIKETPSIFDSHVEDLVVEDAQKFVDRAP